MSRRSPLPRSLHGRLVAVLLGLLLVLGATSLVLILEGSRLFSEEVRFRLDQQVARHVAETVEPFVDGELAEDRLKDLFMHAMVINPTLEIYLLDLEGEVLAYDAPDEKIVRHRVDLGPVQRFLRATAGARCAGTTRAAPPARSRSASIPSRRTGGAWAISTSSWAARTTSRSSPRSSRATSCATRRCCSSGRSSSWRSSACSPWGGSRGPCGACGRIASFRTALAGPVPESADEDEVRALERAYEAMARRIDEQVQELRRTDERRREFVASVSHDLRTPTSAVQGYLETLIDRKGRLDEAERYYLHEMALRQTRRLAKLVGQLFELARLEAREDVPHKEAFSLAELVQDAVCEFQPRADRKGVALRARFPYDLPPVNADIGLIARALDNLIDNALRHTPPRSEVVVHLEHVEGGVELRVSDAGPGIPPEEVPRLFDRFYRIPQAGRDEEGSGLGLAITRRIIDLHDGAISVQSQPEQGTTFSFVLSASHEPA